MIFNIYTSTYSAFLVALDADAAAAAGAERCLLIMERMLASLKPSTRSTCAQRTETCK